MTIPISAPATLVIDASWRHPPGTLGEQILRFLALDREQRRSAAILVESGVSLTSWTAPRTYLDAEAIRELAKDMAARGLI